MPEHSRGTRSQVLFALGLIWCLFAVGLATTTRPATPGLIHTYLPAWVRCVVWAVPGAVALVAVWWRRIDPTAWGLLLIPPLERLVSYLFGWIVGLAGGVGDFPGYRPGWSGVVLYAAVVFLVNRCAAGLDRPMPWDGKERRWTGPQS